MRRLSVGQRLLWPLAAPLSLASLTACSQQESAPPAANQAEAQASEDTANVTRSSPPSQTAVAGSDAARKGESLNANISGLTGDISDLSVRVTEQATIVDIPSDVLFEFDKANLSPAAQGPLGKLLPYVQAGGKGVIVVTGYTDAKGEDAYNLTLSQRRAQAVADWLTDKGIAVAQLTVVGKGEADPIAPNSNADGSDNPNGRAKNRRVSVTIPR